MALLRKYWPAWLLSACSIALLITVWVMYEWPQKPIEKIVTHNVVTTDPAQATQIKNLTAIVAADEKIIADLRHGRRVTALPPPKKPVSPPKEGTGTANANGSGSVGVGVLNGNFTNNPTPQNPDDINHDPTRTGGNGGY